MSSAPSKKCARRVRIAAVDTSAEREGLHLPHVADAERQQTDKTDQTAAVVPSYQAAVTLYNASPFSEEADVGVLDQLEDGCVNGVESEPVALKMSRSRSLPTSKSFDAVDSDDDDSDTSPDQPCVVPGVVSHPRHRKMKAEFAVEYDETSSFLPSPDQQQTDADRDSMSLLNTASDWAASVERPTTSAKIETVL